MNANRKVRIWITTGGQCGMNPEPRYSHISKRVGLIKVPATLGNEILG